MKLEYEDLEFKTPKVAGDLNPGRRRVKMAKKEASTPTTKKQFKTTRLEVAKTVLIAVLITAAVAFMAGVRYESNKNSELMQAIDAAKSEMVQETDTPVKK